MTDKICICDDVTLEETCNCFSCDVVGKRLMNKRTRELKCPLHKIIQCGSVNHYICEKCKIKGWISQALIGGPVHYISNTLTGERIYDKTMISGDPF